MILYNDDCLNVLKGLEDKSIDLILQDPPYNTTACKWEWDIMTKIEEFWKEWNRVIKPNGAIVMFGSEPFSSKLRLSNLKNYKYDWKWKKTIAIGFQHSKNKPMKILEDILVFSNSPMGHISQLGDRRMNYNPQGVIPDKIRLVRKSSHGNMMGARPNQIGKEYLSYTNFPNELLEFNQPISTKSIHPTQKPVELLEYLIKTYTQENEVVFDGFSGSCSTGIACINTNRQFIGVELDEHYYTIGKQRVDEHLVNLKKV